MNYIIDNKFKVKTNHGSKGCQIKYCRNNYWYKLDNGCSEGRNSGSFVGQELAST